jgi:hypothetical protein
MSYPYSRLHLHLHCLFCDGRRTVGLVEEEAVHMSRIAHLAALAVAASSLLSDDRGRDLDLDLVYYCHHCLRERLLGRALHVQGGHRGCSYCDYRPFCMK